VTSQSDGNENNASVDSSNVISDNKMSLEDDSGSEYIGSISNSETSDYTSDNEDSPPPTKILNKEKLKQEGKQQTRK
jgi:hypothetical protein